MENITNNPNSPKNEVKTSTSNSSDQKSPISQLAQNFLPTQECQRSSGKTSKIQPNEGTAPKKIDQVTLRNLIKEKTELSSEDKLNLLIHGNAETKRLFLQNQLHSTLLKNSELVFTRSKDLRMNFIRSIEENSTGPYAWKDDQKIKFIAHLLSDEWISGEELASREKIEGFSAFYFKDYFLLSQDALFYGLKIKKNIVKMLGYLDNLENYAKKPKSLSQQVEDHEGTLYFLAGWDGTSQLDDLELHLKTVGHAISGKIIKTETGYSFYIFNTGAGLNFHPLTSENQAPSYGIVWHNLSSDLLNNPSLMEIFHGKIGTYQEIPYSLYFIKNETTFYVSLWNYFQNKGITGELYGESLTLQRSGTCSKQCFDLIFRDLIFNSPDTKNHEEALLVYKVIKAREKIIALLDTITLIEETHQDNRHLLVAIIREGINELSSSLQKILSKISTEPGHSKESNDEVIQPLLDALIHIEKSFIHYKTNQKISSIGPIEDSSIITLGKPITIIKLAPNDNSSNSKPKPRNPIKKIILDFSNNISKGTDVSEVDIEGYFEALTSLLTSVYEDRTNYTSFSPILFSLIEGLHILTTQEKLTPSGISSILKKVISLQTLIKNHINQPIEKRLWRTGLYLLSAHLFNKLTQRDNPWLMPCQNDKKFPIWSPHSQWNKLLHRLSKSLPRDSGKDQSIFSYQNLGSTPIPVSQCPEYKYIRQEGEVGEILLSLEKFKDILPTSILSSELEQEEGWVSLKRKLSAIDTTSLEPKEIYDKTTLKVFGPDALKVFPVSRGLNPKQSLETLLTNLRYQPNIPIHPAHIHLLESFYTDQSHPLFIPSWVNIMKELNQGILHDPLVIEALKATLYSRQNPKVEFLLSNMNEICQCNIEIGYALFEQIEIGCLSEIYTIHSFSWELLFALEEEFYIKEDWDHPLFVRIQEMRDNFLIKNPLSFDKIITSSDLRKISFDFSILILNLIRKNRLEISSTDFCTLLIAYHHWLLSLDGSDLSTFEEKIASLYSFYIQKNWPLYTPTDQQEILNLFIQAIYPEKSFMIELVPNQPWPSANIFNNDPSAPNALLGNYVTYSQEILFSIPTPAQYQSFLPSYITKALNNIFGNFENIKLNYSKDTHSFLIESDPLTSFSQWNLQKTKTMQVHHEFKELTYSSPIKLPLCSFQENRTEKFIELISSKNPEDKIYAYWDFKRNKLAPKWEITNGVLLWADDTTAPELIGSIAGLPSEIDVSSLLELFKATPIMDMQPIFWFKENQLNAIEFPCDLFFQFKKGKVYLVYRNNSYLVSTLDPGEEALKILHPFAFKLISELDQKEFWFGVKNVSSTSGNDLRMENLRPETDLKYFIERAEKTADLFHKIPLKNGKLRPVSDDHIVYLMKNSLERKLFSQALEWTKKLVVRGTFVPSAHLSTLYQLNWANLVINPATCPIAELLVKKMTAQSANLSNHLPFPELNVDLFKKFSNLLQEKLKELELSKIPNSKLHYLYQPQDTKAQKESSKKLKWEPILSQDALGEIDVPFHDFPRSPFSKSEFYALFNDFNQNVENSLNVLCLSTTIEFEDPPESASGFCGPEEKNFLGQQIQSFMEKFKTTFVKPFFIYPKDYEAKTHGEFIYADVLAKEVAKFHNISVIQSHRPISSIPLNKPQMIQQQSERLDAIQRDQPFYFDLEKVSSQLKELETLKEASISQLHRKLAETESRFFEMLQPLAEKALLSGAAALHREPLPLIETFYPLLLQRNITQWRNLFPHLNLESDAILDLHTFLFSYLWIKTEILHRQKDEARTYEPNAPLSSFFMLYEEMSDLALRPNQVESLSFLLEEMVSSDLALQPSSKSFRRMLQSIMGSGKSKVLVPLVLLFLSRTHNCIPIHITTKPLVHSTYLELSELFYDKFKLHTHLIKATRNMPLESLQLLKEQLIEAKLGKVVLVASSEALNALNLLLPELRLSEKEPDPSYLELAKEISFELNENAFLLVDECDVIFNPKELLSYPFGPPNLFAKSMYSPIVSLFFQHLILFRKELGIDVKKSHLYATPELISSICKKMAKRIIESTQNPILKQWISLSRQTGLTQEAIEENAAKLFSQEALPVTSKEKIQQAIDSTSPIQLKDAFLEIKMYQTLFGKEAQLLKALHSMYNSEYGLSLQDLLRHSVIPYSSGNPQENRQFDEAIQILLKTSLHYLHGWESLDRIKVAIQEGISFLKKPLPSAEHTTLTAAFDFYQIDRGNPLVNLHKVAEKINEGLNCNDPHAPIAQHAQTIISFFLNECAFPKELKQYLIRLTSTPSTTLAMYPKIIALSGTLEGASAWMDQFTGKMDEQIIPRITTKALLDPIARLSSSSSTLHDQLTELWTLTTAETRALIDVGGIFRGKSPLSVAKEILHVSRHAAEIQGCNKPKVQGILFHPLGETGYAPLSLLLPDGQVFPLASSRKEDILSATIEHGLLQSQEITDISHPLQSLYLFTYYDQAHARGTDIPHHATAHALITYDPKCTLTDLQQGAMRMRGYLEEQSLTWIYAPIESQELLTMETLLATAQKTEEEQEYLALAQSCLNDLSALAIKYFHFSLKPSNDSIDIGPLKESLVQKIIEPDYLNILEPQTVTYYDQLIEVKKKFEELKNQYRETSLHSIIENDYDQWMEKYTRLLEQKGDEKILELSNLEGTVEMSLEQELQQEQVCQSHGIDFSSLPDPSSIPLLPEPINCSRQAWTELPSDELIGKCFWIRHLLPENLPPSLCNKALALSSALFLDLKQSQFRKPMWEDGSITYPINRIVIYSSLVQTSEQIFGVLTHGNEAFTSSPNRIRKDYTLKGDCIFKETLGASVNTIENLGYFKEKNIFECSSLDDPVISMMCSGIILSGDITVLDEAKSQRNKIFFTWLNQHGDNDRSERLKLFFQTYNHRTDRAYLGLYTQGEFEKLMKRLEQLSRVKE
jgi:hypothetical protein